MWLILRWWSSVLDCYWLAEALEEQARRDWREPLQAAVAKARRATKASGGKTRFGSMRKPSNQHLEWAFIEADNVVVRHR